MLYEAGFSCREIAGLLGYSTLGNIVNLHLREAGVKLRGPGGPNSPKYRDRIQARRIKDLEVLNGRC